MSSEFCSDIREQGTLGQFELSSALRLLLSAACTAMSQGEFIHEFQTCGHSSRHCRGLTKFPAVRVDIGDRRLTSTGLRSGSSFPWASQDVFPVAFKLTQPSPRISAEMLAGAQVMRPCQPEMFSSTALTFCWRVWKCEFERSVKGSRWPSCTYRTISDAESDCERDALVVYVIVNRKGIFITLNEKRLGLYAPRSAFRRERRPMIQPCERAYGRR